MVETDNPAELAYLAGYRDDAVARAATVAGPCPPPWDAAQP